MARKIEYSAKFKRNYVALFALLIFCLLIVGELLLALSVPWLVRRGGSFAAEIRRREMLMAFDEARRRSHIVPENSETLILEKKLLADTLDDLALYLRGEADRLTPEEVNELTPLVRQLCRVAIQLGKGESFSEESRIDSAGYLNSLIRKHGERKHE